MNCRRFVSVLSLLSIVFLGVFLVNCNPYKQTSLAVTPANANLGSPGNTIQFHAIETSTDPNRADKSTDVTSQVTWESSNPAAATIEASGLATTVGEGTTTITATTNGSFGVLNGHATLIASGHDLLSLAIIPGAQTLYATGETAQFIAIGTFNTAPTTQDVTDLVSWISSDVNIATINPSGLATAVSCPPEPGGAGGCGTAITARANFVNGGAITSTTPSSLSVNQTTGGSVLPSLTVYEVGLGTGTVTSNPPVINCAPTVAPGSGASTAGCTANFILNTPVTLTATAKPPFTFGGWSSNCVPNNAPTCTLTMTNSETVGAIFNQP